MKRIVLALMIAFTGCTTISMTCPDKISTVAYKGISLTGTTSVSCVPTAGGGYTIQVGGIDLLALAATIAPLVAAHPKSAQGSGPN